MLQMNDITASNVFYTTVSMCISVYCIAKILWPGNEQKERTIVSANLRLSPFIPSWLYIRIKFFLRGVQLLDEAYTTRTSTAFCIPDATGSAENIFVTTPAQISELGHASSNSLPIYPRLVTSLQTAYTMPGLFEDERKADKMVALVRRRISGNIPGLLPDLVDESVFVLKQQLGDGAVLNAFDLALRLIAQASSRAFVGLELARNETYIHVVSSFTQSVMLGAPVINIFPAVLKPFASKYLCNVWNKIRTASDCVRPVIARRLREIEQNGGPLEHDVLQGLLDLATSDDGEVNVTEFSIRLLSINFGSLFTTSFMLINTLYELAARPSYMEPLREEVSSVLSANGGSWTKDAIDNLHRLDSFLKEVQRLHPHEASSIARTVSLNKPYTFSDGTHVPAGASIAVPTGAIMKDPSVMVGGGAGQDFDGFRYYRARIAASSSSSAEGAGFDYATTSMDALGFGYGSHACPGRFFASCELKMIVGWMIQHYDITWADERRPSGWSVLTFNMPDMSLRLRFTPRA